MDVKKLDYFVHVVELGSFTKAALQLSIAQSALSGGSRLESLRASIYTPVGTRVRALSAVPSRARMEWRWTRSTD